MSFQLPIIQELYFISVGQNHTCDYARYTLQENDVPKNNIKREDFVIKCYS